MWTSPVPRDVTAGLFGRGKAPVLTTDNLVLETQQPTLSSMMNIDLSSPEALIASKVLLDMLLPCCLLWWLYKAIDGYSVQAKKVGDKACSWSAS